MSPQEAIDLLSDPGAEWRLCHKTGERRHMDGERAWQEITGPTLAALAVTLWGSG